MKKLPNKLKVGIGSDLNPNGPSHSNGNHLPADYYTDESDDFDYDTDRYTPPKPRVEPTAKIMTPPKKLTIPEIGDEGRRRFMSDNSPAGAGLNGANSAAMPSQGSGHDSAIFQTPNDTFLRNMNSFSAGDPVSNTKQIRHLHNRLRLLEDELQTQHNRQIFIIGVLSFYFITKGVNWMYR